MNLQETLRSRIEESMKRGDFKGYLDFVEKNKDLPQFYWDDFNRARSFVERAAIAGGLKRISRDSWADLPLPEQGSFVRSGGTLYDDARKPPEDRGTIRSKSGKEATRDQWDAMDIRTQAAFINS